MPVDLNAEMRAEAARLEAQATKMEADARDGAKKLRARARLLREAAADDTAAANGLRGGGIRATVDAVSPAQIAGVASGARRQRGSDLHPFQEWLYTRTAGPQTIAEVADAIGVGKQLARSWTRSSAPRRIPESCAAEIARRWGYPATVDAWPNGIRAGR